jgi:nucleotide-binding universal stress UspA family protein
MKILLAIDGSPCSNVAIEEVARRPWPQKSTVKVLTTFELPLPATPEPWPIPQSYLEQMDRVAKEEARRTVDSAVATLSSKLSDTMSVDSKIVPGSPSTTILDEAESWGADLIVVGSHSYGAWQRLLLGSVSQTVVSHANCSVEVVRCAMAAKGEVVESNLVAAAGS